MVDIHDINVAQYLSDPQCGWRSIQKRPKRIDENGLRQLKDIG